MFKLNFPYHFLPLESLNFSTQTPSQKTSKKTSQKPPKLSSRSPPTSTGVVLLVVVQLADVTVGEAGDGGGGREALSGGAGRRRGVRRVVGRVEELQLMTLSLIKIKNLKK